MINQVGNKRIGLGFNLNLIGGALDPLLAAYKDMVESDGGMIQNTSPTVAMLHSIDENSYNGLVVAPWAGVRLRESAGQFFVEKAYSMSAYMGSTFFHPEQVNTDSQPEQVGEEWVFDGVDDYLSVDPGAHPDQFTIFWKVANMADTSNMSIINQIHNTGDSTSRWQAAKLPGSDTFVVAVYTGSGGAGSVSTSDTETNYIATVNDTEFALYKAGVLADSTSGSSINPAGDTEIRIGIQLDGGAPFEGNATGATGLITSVLDQEQVTEFNALQ